MNTVYIIFLFLVSLRRVGLACISTKQASCFKQATPTCQRETRDGPHRTMRKQLPSHYRCGPCDTVQCSTNTGSLHCSEQVRFFGIRSQRDVHSAQRANKSPNRCTSVYLPYQSCNIPRVERKKVYRTMSSSATILYLWSN